MPRADFRSFFESRHNVALATLTLLAFVVALFGGVLARRGAFSPGGAMLCAAFLGALPAAWYTRGFLLQKGDESVALLISALGWALATLSFLARAANPETRAATLLAIGAGLLMLAGASLSLSKLLLGNSQESASTRGGATKTAPRKSLEDALRDVQDL